VGDGSQQTQLGFADNANASSVSSDDAPTSQDGNTPTQAPGLDNGEPREKRSRDRYGRERGPRGEREERPDLRIPVQAVSTQANDLPEASAPAAVVAASLMDRVTAAAPQVVAAVKAPVPTAPVERMPKVTSYSLPTEALVDVAQGSGLQWVNSDAAKIEAVQAAIAAEPKPIHVPRERPAPVSIDTGPLVLVETKRDLRNMTLPFEQPPAA
jgi:ribonuclease E